MNQYKTTCTCGRVEITLLVKDSECVNNILNVYCAECSVFNYPQLNILYINNEHSWSAEHESQVISLDHKAVAIFSPSFFGFFVIKFKTFFTLMEGLIEFNLPLRDSVQYIPRCFSCKYLKPKAFSENRLINFCELFSKELSNHDKTLGNCPGYFPSDSGDMNV